MKQFSIFYVIIQTELYRSGYSRFLFLACSATAQKKTPPEPTLAHLTTELGKAQAGTRSNRNGKTGRSSRNGWSQ